MNNKILMFVENDAQKLVSDKISRFSTVKSDSFHSEIGYLFLMIL